MIKAINLEEQTILEGVKNADGETISKLYKQYLPGIVAYVRRNNGGESDAQDLFQEALVCLFRKVREGNLVLTTSLEGYLATICRYQWRDKLKRHYVTKEVRMEVVDNYDYEDPDQDMMNAIQETAKKKIYQQAFLKLDETCRAILSLFFQKTPMKEIAVQLGTTEGYAKKRKGVCRDKLFDFIKQDPSYEELKNE